MCEKYHIFILPARARACLYSQYNVYNLEFCSIDTIEGGQRWEIILIVFLVIHFDNNIVL